MQTKDLGRFHVTCGAITAVDPVTGFDCAVTFKAKNGPWLATIEAIPEDEDDSTRVTSVTVRHVDHPKASPDVLIEGEVGADTGNAGFFDAESDEEAADDVIGLCKGEGDGNSILSEHGVLCVSGYGDGCYPCLVALKGDKAVAARMVFISEDGGWMTRR
jgi:hypothetical protein